MNLQTDHNMIQCSSKSDNVVDLHVQVQCRITFEIENAELN